MSMSSSASTSSVVSSVVTSFYEDKHATNIQNPTHILRCRQCGTSPRKILEALRFYAPEDKRIRRLLEDPSGLPGHLGFCEERISKLEPARNPTEALRLEVNRYKLAVELCKRVDEDVAFFRIQETVSRPEFKMELEKADSQSDEDDDEEMKEDEEDEEDEEEKVEDEDTRRKEEQEYRQYFQFREMSKALLAATLGVFNSQGRSGTGQLIGIVVVPAYPIMDIHRRVLNLIPNALEGANPFLIGILFALARKHYMKYCRDPQLLGVPDISPGPLDALALNPVLVPTLKPNNLQFFTTDAQEDTSLDRVPENVARRLIAAIELFEDAVDCLEPCLSELFQQSRGREALLSFQTRLAPLYRRFYETCIYITDKRKRKSRRKRCPQEFLQLLDVIQFTEKWFEKGRCCPQKDWDEIRAVWEKVEPRLYACVSSLALIPAGGYTGLTNIQLGTDPAQDQIECKQTLIKIFCNGLFKETLTDKSKMWCEDLFNATMDKEVVAAIRQEYKSVAQECAAKGASADETKTSLALCLKRWTRKICKALPEYFPVKKEMTRYLLWRKVYSTAEEMKESKGPNFKVQMPLDEDSGKSRDTAVERALPMALEKKNTAMAALLEMMFGDQLRGKTVSPASLDVLLNWLELRLKTIAVGLHGKSERYGQLSFIINNSPKIAPHFNMRVPLGIFVHQLGHPWKTGSSVEFILNHVLVVLQCVTLVSSCVEFAAKAHA